MKLMFRVFGLTLMLTLTAFVAAHGEIYNDCWIDCDDGSQYHIHNTDYETCCRALHDMCYGKGGGTATLYFPVGDQMCPPY